MNRSLCLNNIPTQRLQESLKKVTVIMRCKNNDWVISQSLLALFSQSFTDFELLVVDSGSTDTTLEIVKQYPCQLMHIKASEYFPGKVLNKAITACTSELIVFLNADSVLLTPDSLKNLIHNFDQDKISAVFGRQIPRPEADTWVRHDYALSFPNNTEAPPWMSFSLPLAAMRRSAWEAHHFYSIAWASEDTEWGVWAKKNNHNIVYDPHALTMHSHNYSLKEIYGRRFVEGEADAFIYKTKITTLTCLINIAKSILKDLKAHLTPHDTLGFFASPFRRSVYHWAYLKGNRVGNHRKEKNIDDQCLGQSVVFKSALR